MAHRVYVGNLPFTCTPDDLKSLFAAHAPTGSSIVLDRDTGRSRGFGFVDFATTEAMLLAIQALNGHEVDGRPLSVSEARERQPGDRPRGPFGQPGAGSRPASGAPRPAFGGPATSARPGGSPPAYSGDRDRPGPAGRKPWAQKERDRWSDGGGKPRRRRSAQEDEEGF